MKAILPILIAASLVCTSKAQEFNVNFDETMNPQISGPGGELPPPAGLPYVSNLAPSPGDTTHSDGPFGVLWLDSYQSGDYFSFSLLESDPDKQITLTGIWFGVYNSPMGPQRFVVELWSGGDLINSESFDSPGVHLRLGYDWTSADNAAELRIVGVDGTDRQESEVGDDFGVFFISTSFTVVPEPSSALLITAAVSLFLTRRVRR